MPAALKIALMLSPSAPLSMQRSISCSRFRCPIPGSIASLRFIQRQRLIAVLFGVYLHEPRRCLRSHVQEFSRKPRKTLHLSMARYATLSRIISELCSSSGPRGLDGHEMNVKRVVWIQLNRIVPTRSTAAKRPYHNSRRIIRFKSCIISVLIFPVLPNIFLCRLQQFSLLWKHTGGHVLVRKPYYGS